MTTDRKLPPSRTADQFVLRLPEGMREKVAAAASEAGRSMNAEFIRRIEQSFEPVEPSLPLSVEAKRQIGEDAAEYGRTFSEEIANKLENSLAWDQAVLPASLGKKLTAYRKAHGLDSKQALERLVSAGLHADAPCVVVLNVGGDVDIEQLGATLDEVRSKLPKKTALIVDQYPKIPTKSLANK